ncbi:surface layer protein [Mycobacterium sp. shizuoka-1]|uniref:surface layer protein n=1 Tax=Mycobacterium sp. shizuoka-1 TaxID=2039281 RepID=UPI000C0663C4|nr:surface layer protein [Mycobacterium sp. shizuoka-1]GAY17837.1 putative surface layer protein [Mycobacterium sp. shizuoka-1]
MNDDSPRAGRDGDVLAVVSQSGPTVTFFDAATDGPLGVLDLLAEPHELCFDATHRQLWCTNTYHSGYYHANQGRRTQLTVIDPDERRIVDVVDLAPEHAPHGLALDSTRNRLYVSVEGDADRPGGVVVIDTVTRKVLGRMSTGAPGPHWFVIDATGRKGFATNKEAPFVSILDLATEELVTVDVPGSEGLAVSPDGSEIYVAAPYGSFTASGSQSLPTNGIRVIDTESARVVDVLATEHVVFPVCLTGDGVLLAAELRMTPGGPSALGSHLPGRLNAFDTATRQRIATVELTGRFPLTMTASPDGRLGYVAAVTSSTVDIVDLRRWEVLNSLAIAKRGEPGAHGLAYIPRPN